MTTINVSFTDATESVINAYFGSPQGTDAWPHQAEIDSNDPRWVTYYATIPASLQVNLPAPAAS